MLKEPRVSIIGTGRMAKALVAALTRCNIVPECLLCRDIEKGYQTAYKSQFEVQLLKDGTQLNADIIFLAVSDDHIGEVSKKLNPKENNLLVHTSGVKGLEIIQHFADNGGKIASMHPVQTIPEHADLNIFNESTFSLLCNDTDFLLLESLCKQMGGNSIRVTPQEKKQIHISAVFMSNYLVTLAHVAEQVLHSKDSKHEIPLSILKPLMKKTLDEIFREGTHQALTGPISRGDVNTISEHIDVLKTLNLTSIEVLYSSLGCETTKLAHEANRIDNKMRVALEKLFTPHE